MDLLLVGARRHPRYLADTCGGGAKERVTSDGGGWVGHESPDGKRGPESLYYVACGSGDAAVHVMNWATVDDRLLSPLEGAHTAWIPSSVSVSPDGSAVLYQRTIGGGMDLMLIENFR